MQVQVLLFPSRPCQLIRANMKITPKLIFLELLMARTEMQVILIIGIISVQQVQLGLGCPLPNSPNCKSFRGIEDSETEIAENSGTTRIWNGSRTKKRYPFMVAILDVVTFGYPRLICGGVLINNQHVVTAAHCVKYIEEAGKNAQFWIGVSDISIDSKDVGVQKFNWTKSFQGDFNETTFEGDFAVFKLKGIADISGKHVKPICIRTKNVGSIAVTLIGFGLRNNSLESWTTYLQHAHGYTLPNDQCKCRDQFNQSYSVAACKLSSDQICAVLRNDAGKYAEIQPGDSGGPLFCKNSRTNKFVLVGTVSSYENKGIDDSRPNPNFLGVYVRIGMYTEFIQKIAGKIDVDC